MTYVAMPSRPPPPTACKTWTTLKDVDATNPILPTYPTCATDGNLLPLDSDSTFESRSKVGFTRYRLGSTTIQDELDNDGNVVNTFLRNQGRGNVKDGLEIALENFTH